MKKIITSLLVGAAVCAAVPVSGMIKANAGEKQTVFMEEQFSNDALDQTKWTASGESIELYADKETGYITSGSHLEQHHISINQALENLDYIQFDLKILAKKWMALYFTPELKTTLADYDPQLFMNMAGDGKYSSGSGQMSFNNYLIPATMGEWMTMKFKRTSATTMDIYVCERGQDIDKATPTTMTVKSGKVSFDKFYFAIAGEGGQEFSMDNIIVKSGSVNFEERVYSANINENLKAYGMGYKIFNPDSSLTFKASPAGEGITYNTAMPVEESIIESLEVMKIGFKANFTNAQAGDAVAYAFGIGEGQTYTTDSYACVLEKDGVSIVRYENGTASVLLEKVAASLINDTMVEVVANKNGEISVYLNDEWKGSYTVEEADYYAGSFGFYAAAANTGDVAVDNVRMTSKLYKVPVTKSVSHNFSNNYFGNEGFEDFVVNAHNGDKGIYVKDGKLVFDNVADDAYFGSAHEYDNFILDYKLCSVKVGENATAKEKWLGLDIGRNVPGKAQYGTHFMLAYTIVPTASEVGLWAYAYDTSDLDANDLNKRIVHNKRIPKEYFDAIQYDDVTKMESEVLEKDAICVRYVAENGTIRMYLKRACEAEYQLYATLSGVETTGYVTLNVTGWTTLKIDDFTMTNISGVYVNADSYAPETIVKENQVVVYDNNLMGDPLAMEEARANVESDGGMSCASVVSAGWCVLPLLTAGIALVKKNRKDEDK